MSSPDVTHDAPRTGEEIRQEEEGYLRHVLQRIPERIAEIEAQIRKTDQSEFIEENIKRKVTRGMARERDSIRAIGQSAPYFGRFALEARDSHADTPHGTFYVGRTSLEKASGDDSMSHDYLVLDYREEICSLYYRHSQSGPVSYRPHRQTFRVHFSDKRQIQIEAAQVVSVHDGEGRRLDAAGLESLQEKQSDTAGSWQDPFLAEALAGRHASGRLGDIVQTIQAEQDEIIRSSAQVLVVQGPAGSGKTICALQRAAQLLYDRRKRRRDLLIQRGGYDALDDELSTISAQQMLVLSPNAIFSDYISRVLPNLNEGEIRQEIFEDLIRTRLSRRLRPVPAEKGKTSGKAWRIEKRSDRYEEVFDGMSSPAREAATAFKSSSRLLGLLETFVEEWTQAFAASAFTTDILLDGYHAEEENSAAGVFFGAEALRRRFLTRVSAGDIPLTALNLTVAAVRERQKDYAGRPVVEQRIKDRLSKAVTAFETMVRAVATTYFRSSLPDLYKAFWESVRGAEEANSEVIETAEHSLRFLTAETRLIPSEDIVPMLLLDGLLNGFETSLGMVEHAIVDEGQDYSPLHFEYLRRILPAPCGFTIVGDVNQGIDTALSLGDWERLVPVFGSRLERMELVRSYRSSQEITDLASAILGSGSTIENVRRTGRLPRLHLLPDATRVTGDKARVAAETRAVAQAVRDLAERGHRSVGVVCRSRAEVVRVARGIQALGIVATPLTDQTRTLSGEAGVLVAPLYFAKGLEFDAVVVADVSEASYGRESDRRVLYTACTRPLHDLVLIQSQSSALSPLLPPLESGLYTIESGET